MLLLALFGAVSWIDEQARQEIAAASAGRLYADAADTPPRTVGLVLGTSSMLAGGGDNLYFINRIDAAASLYKAGKLRYLLVSGDNRRRSYDEPAQMRRALLERGVPATAIYCDYAGITTLDSVLRAGEVFGMRDDLIIISQGFHNQRALYLAAHHGIDAIALNAREVTSYNGTRTLTRERAARLRAWWDIHVTDRGPRHLGPAIPIGTAPSSCND
ncbi:MAG: SanA protein [Betaproteobacteria bacterium]|nr:SanA protein [Betaproteobacteria bacterium]